MRRPRLESGTTLVAAPGLAVVCEKDGSCTVHGAGGRVSTGVHTLAVVDAFRAPLALEDGLARLATRIPDVNAMAGVVQTIQALAGAGALVTPGAAAPSRELQDALAPYALLLNDRARNHAYMEAIARTVRPGDVVLEIGTGTGGFAVAAVRAGARRVYAVEPGAIAAVARETFHANGVAERVTLIDGWSEEIELPERADVLITDTVGDDPLGLHVLQLIGDARARLLKPGARLVPRRLRLRGSPVRIADHATDFASAARTAVGTWRSWYGMDFSALARPLPAREESFFATSPEAREWPVLAGSVLLADLELAAPREGPVRGREVVTATRSGRLDALVTYIELGVGPSVTLSTRPDRAGAGSIWKHRVIVFEKPLELKRNDRFAVSWAELPGHGHRITASARRVRS